MTTRWKPRPRHGEGIGAPEWVPGHGLTWTGASPAVATCVGVVTGGGHIESPPGALADGPALAGLARFGFMSTRMHGEATPECVTAFEFADGGLHFHSSSCRRLVLSGRSATYEGSGFVNGVGGHSFQLTAIEGGDGGADSFRIKIWTTATRAVVYDSLPSAGDIEATAPIADGSIAVYAA